MCENKIIILGVIPTETGKVHQQSRVVYGGGIAPCITARDYKDPIRTLVEIDDVYQGKASV